MAHWYMHTVKKRKKAMSNLAGTRSWVTEKHLPSGLHVQPLLLQGISMKTQIKNFANKSAKTTATDLEL